MPFKTLTAFVALASLLPNQAAAHTEYVSDAAPVAAIAHFLGTPDHVAGIILLIAVAALMVPRVRARAVAALRGGRRR